MIVALYARVSTTRQAEKDLSIPDQIRQMRQWCKANGQNVAIEYIEPGASATDDRRQVFQQMIDEACKTPPPYSAIIVHSFSRFFRDSVEFGLYERKLKKYGVQLISITQQTSDDPAGEMARRIFNVFDEYQSRENAKHTLRAMKENARQGFFNGSTPPYGYRLVEVPIKGRRGMKKKLEIDPAESLLVKKIFDLYTNGFQGNFLGLQGVAAHLNERGFTRRGRKWSKTDIDCILNNEAYVGEYYFNKKDAQKNQIKPKAEWIRVQIPSIIDRDLFESAGNMKKLRSPALIPPRIVNSPNLLTGLVKCGICGSSMTSATGKGGRYRYYKCSKRMNQGAKSCINGNVRMEKLDETVLKTVSEKIFIPNRVENMLKSLVKKIQSKKRSEGGKIKQLNRELAEIKQAQQNLFEALEKGLLPMDETLKERAHRHQARKQELLIEIARIQGYEHKSKLKIGREQINRFCEILTRRFKDPSSPFAKNYLHILISQITITGKEVLITGNTASILHALPKIEPGTLDRVPGFVPEWLPG